MPDGSETSVVRVLGSINDIDAAAWDACAGPGDPFVCHAFLSALEDSGSATAETGWLAQHLVLDDAGGNIAAVAPLYLKNHSYGEYVFDWGWADAYARAGGTYYPKLLSGVPFTLHDLRRTFITIAESLELSQYAIKHLVNHKTPNDVTAGYIIIAYSRA